MKNIISVLTLVLLFLSNIVYSDSNLNFDLDYAFFRAENSKFYLEIYYAFNQDELLFVKKNNAYNAGGKLSLDLYSGAVNGNIVMKDYFIPLTINDTSSYEKHSKLTGQIIYLVDTGFYKINVKACDINDTLKCFSTTKEIHLKSIHDNAVSSSSVQLSTGIKKSADQNSPFYKNTLEVIPNPSNLFGNNLSELYYYIELYNLKKDLLTDNYFIKVLITDNEGKEYQSQLKNYNVFPESKVEHGKMDIKKIPTGTYTLYVKIYNDQNSELLSVGKTFYIYNSNIVLDDANLTDMEKEYLLSEYPKMTEEQLDDEFNKAIYIMTDKNKKKYGEIKDLNSKRVFMFAFWDALDPNPLTPESEFKTEYYKKIDYSNKNFKSSFIEGWKTDRGRIYCLYGKYDEIERHSYEGSTRAYEIWFYNNIQGGVIFVFIDRSAGYGDYFLEHSTAINEIFDDNWHDKLRIK